MSDEALIRREQLKSLKLSPTELAARMPTKDGEKRRSPSYFSDLMNNPAKSFGEKAARAIEEGLSLPRGWLDQAPQVDESSEVDNRSAADQPADDGIELKQALAVVRKHLARAQGRASAEAAEALKLLALTPDSDRAFAATLAALLVQDQHQAQPAQPEEPAAATEDDWRELRKRAMRVAETSASPAKREQAAQLMRLLDQTIRDGAVTEDAARSRHGNNSPAKSAR